MTRETGPTDRPAALLHGEVRRLIERVLTELQHSLTELEGQGESLEEARRRHMMLRHHVKELQAVFEIEGYLDTSGQSESDGSIDLESARNEVRERLLRLRNAGGSRDVSGEPE
ncbi:MAG: hypothetical protein AAGA32_01385 [Pseudomonadota bacterium]